LLTFQLQFAISGLFLPAVVRPILDSWETAENVPPPPLNDVCDLLCFLVVPCAAFKLKLLTLFPFKLPIENFILHNLIPTK
jgi:hypothetical protein